MPITFRYSDCHPTARLKACTTVCSQKMLFRIDRLEYESEGTVCTGTTPRGGDRTSGRYSNGGSQKSFETWCLVERQIMSSAFLHDVLFGFLVIVDVLEKVGVSSIMMFTLKFLDASGAVRKIFGAGMKACLCHRSVKRRPRSSLYPRSSNVNLW